MTGGSLESATDRVAHNQRMLLGLGWTEMADPAEIEDVDFHGCTLIIPLTEQPADIDQRAMTLVHVARR